MAHNKALENHIKSNKWDVHWRMTESSGLQIYLADYKKHRVLWEGSLPYVTIDHQRQDYDLENKEPPVPHGPFWMPLGARTLAAPVRQNYFHGGFELCADFLCGPFRYTQMWRFHSDGRMAPWLTIHGHGIHDSHTYHPHWRFDFDIDGAANDALEHFENGRWHRVAEEGWLPTTTADSQGLVWRQVDFGSDYSVGICPYAWEDAELFAIRYHDHESLPFSPQNAQDSPAFPAAYLGTESLDGQDVTLWYVAHIHFDAAFPFTAGPWIQVAS